VDRSKWTTRARSIGPYSLCENSDTQTGKLVHILRGHTRPVQTLRYIDKGARIISASADDTIRIWDTQTGDLLYTLQGHEESITALSYDPLRDTIASASATTVRLWDIRPMAEMQLLQGHTRSIWAAAHHPSLPQIVSADGDGVLHIWNRKTGQSRDRFMAPMIQ